MRAMRRVTGVMLVVAYLPLAGCLDFNLDLDINSNGSNAAPPISKPTYGIAKGVNDTGITTCGNYAYDSDGSDKGGHDNATDCNAAGATQTVDGISNGLSVPAGQDAVYGRDAAQAASALIGALAKKGAGPAGFDYTKLDANGDELPDSASAWTCVRDNVTHLIWEVKTAANVDEGFNWYSDDDSTNGYGANDVDFRARGKRDASCDSVADEAGCKDTQGYTLKINQQALCGFTNWRLPTVDELLSLVNKSVKTGVMANTDYLGPVSTKYHWSSTSSAMQALPDSGAFAVWVVDFQTGTDVGTSSGGKGNGGRAIRLVRSAP